ncbi:MAG: 2-oxo acid dehydrogenase subunit E2 [Chloroflexi bacterium]|nr:2-oxo acid dehydrogenase subunit E2 [Chloroflexota bacterium]
MATNIIMPALEMAQTTGKLVRWIKLEGATVVKGEPIMEIETDKVTVEIESPASGILSGLLIHEGDTVPVGQTIAWLVASGESVPSIAPTIQSGRTIQKSVEVNATPDARKMAEEHGVELSRLKSNGGRIEKADVLAYLSRTDPKGFKNPSGLKPASPKARRLASERSIDLSTLRGSGPNGAVLALDIPISNPQPHFASLRGQASPITNSWREQAQKRVTEKITYTDLLVKVVAAALAKHPRLNVSWSDNSVVQHNEINVGVAVAVEDGLIVPVIHRADRLGLGEIAARRIDLVTRAQAGKLHLEDIQGGTFTISNLGMYGVDEFQAILNSPQAAILAVGRIAERVVPSGGVPVVQPMMTLSLSCDHRAVDGARGAQFISTLSELIQEPLGMLD